MVGIAALQPLLPSRVINGRQTMSASAAAFFESSRRGRGRPAGLMLDVVAGRHPRRGDGRRLARERGGAGLGLGNPWPRPHREGTARPGTAPAKAERLDVVRGGSSPFIVF
jgi:hypothetical protein